jgi:hypothetical protein
MKNFLKISVGILMTGSLLISPVLASANNGKGHDNDENENNSHVTVKAKVEHNMGCFKENRFGDFFIFRWLNRNKNINLDGVCNKNASTTPDTTAPVISDFGATPRTTYALISWNTDENSDSNIYISTTSPVNTSGNPTSKKNQMTKTHRVIVGNLKTGTTYYVMVTSKDKKGNVATSSQISFTTLGSLPPVDNQAPLISAIITNVSSTSVMVNWTTDEPATSKVFYNAGATVDANATTTPFVSSNSLVLNHSVNLPSLGTSTQYTFMIESLDSHNNRGLSSAMSTTTLAL